MVVHEHYYHHCNHLLACILALLLTTATSATSTTSTTSTTITAQYCIIGAGPGGIQLGHFLDRAGRDYVIFEKKATAGNFFRDFPRQRKLISINKRFRGSTDINGRELLTESFAMRHDWNSLLGNATPPMTERTRDLYPSADELYKYFEDFSQGQHILFNTTVVSLTRSQQHHTTTASSKTSKTTKTTTPKPPPFQVQTSTSFNSNDNDDDDTKNKTWSCDNVILANGVAIPNRPNFIGHQHVLDYSDLPRNGSWADGHRVLVLGFGNAALEAAMSVNGWATEITVLGRPQPLPSPWRDGGPKHGLRMSYHTHYVGDMRQVNLNILDMYQLKSLDGFSYMMGTPYTVNNHPFGIFQGTNIFLLFEQFPCIDLDNINFEYTEQLNPNDDTYGCKKGRRQYVEIVGQVLDVLAIEYLTRNIGDLTGYSEQRNHWEKIGQDVIVRKVLSNVEGDASERLENSLTRQQEKISNYASGGGKRLEYTVLISIEAMTFQGSNNVGQKVVDLVHRFIRDHGNNDPFRFGFHSIVRCFGWGPDRELSQKVQPAWHEEGTKRSKYPKTTSVFESINVTNLWYAGALTHGLDYRKAAGGFVHGFRYNARVLFHALNWKHHHVHWPYTNIPLKENVRERSWIKNEAVNDVNEEKKEMKEDVDVENLLNWFEYRANNGDGTYQMFGQLVDACVFFLGDDETPHVRCMEEIPHSYLNDQFLSYPRISLQFVYGPKHHGPKVFEIGAVGATDGRNAEKSTFLHPKLMFFPKGRNDSTWNHHLVEDVPTHFSTTMHRPFLQRYLTFVLSRLTNDRAPPPNTAGVGADGDDVVEMEVTAAGDGVLDVDDVDVVEEQYKETLLATFRETDENNDGEVTADEIDVNLLFKMLRSFDDDDDDGHDQMHEANNVLAKALIHLFDEDQDGTLKGEEYVALLQKLIGRH